MTALCGTNRRISTGLEFHGDLKTLLAMCCSAAVVYLTFCESVCLRSSLLTLVGPFSGVGLLCVLHSSLPVLLAKSDTQRWVADMPVCSMWAHLRPSSTACSSYIEPVVFANKMRGFIF